jgi:PAS domain S-box-containing protein
MEPQLEDAPPSRRASDTILALLSNLAEHPAIDAGNIAALAADMVAQFAKVVPADVIGIWMSDPSDGCLHCIARSSWSREPPGRDFSLTADAASELLQVLSDHTRLISVEAFSDSSLPKSASELRQLDGTTTFIGHAIRSAGQNVGLITLERRHAHSSWRDIERDLCGNLAGILSLAHANNLQRQAIGTQQISEARFRALSDKLPGAIYQRAPDPTLPFAYISSGIEKFTGDAPIQIGSPKALGWAHFIHPDDLARVVDAYREAINGTEYAVEYRVSNPSGTEMWVMDRGSGTIQGDGQPLLEGILFNITPRKRAEEAARTGTSLQGAILNNVSHAVIATDAKGTITFFNRAAEDMLGYTATELVGRQTPLIFHDLDEVRSRMQLAQQSLGREILYPFEIFTVDALGKQPSESEWAYIRKDGRRLSIRLSVTTIRSEDGELTGFLGIATDISDRKKLASRLRQSEDIASRILLQSPDAILITSLRDGRIIEANPGFEQITGITRQSAIGRSTIELGIWADLEERNSMIDSVRQTGEVTSFPIRINQRGGSLRYCAMWARTFTFDGEPALLSVVHDVTEMRLATRAAQESEWMLQAILDTLPSHVFWKDRNSKYMGCNKQFAVDNGHAQPADIVGKTDYELLTTQSPKQLAEIDLVIQTDVALLESEVPSIVRNGSFVMPDGSTHWMRVIKVPLRDASGAVTGILGVQHDITELLQNERAAQEAEKLLKAVLDAIPSRVFWKDRDSVYLGCNREFVSDAGVAADTDIVGKTDDDLPWRNKAEDFRKADRRIIESGIPQMGLVELYEMPLGPPRWFDVSKLPLIGADGEAKGVLGIGTDVTDQRAALEQLRASEEKLRALFERSPLGVTLTTKEGRFLEANDAFLKIIGHDRQALPMLTYQMLTPQEFVESDLVQAQIISATGSYGPYEKEYVRKDGSRIAVSLNGSMVSGPGGTSYVWTTIEDITLRRAAEDVQRRINDELERLVADRTAELKAAMEGLMRAEKLASLGSLVAGVAHEISTPVGNASLATSTMAGNIGDFEKQMADRLTRSTLEGFVRQIKLGTDIANRNIERVANLIQSFKQVAVDQTSSQRRQFHLTEIVDEIVTTMHPTLKRSSVQVQISVPGDIVLDSYPGPLGQILTNLINNSLVHAFPAGKAGTIRIVATQPDTDNLCLGISDDGAGIPSTVLSRIFDPFFTSKLGQGGSGLGLHIVHNIVSGVLAGTIVVSSEVGHGTTFTLTLPRNTPDSNRDLPNSERGLT